MFRLTTRRSLWAPALVVVGVAIGIASMLGVTASARTWPFWVLGLAALIALVAWVDRRLQPRFETPVVTDAESEPERRRKPTPAGAAQSGAYDLERDRSTDKQRYLM